MKVHVYVKAHSERVPGKNLRPLGGVPLWRRQLLKFREHDVYLDTDAPSILEEVRSSRELDHVTAYARLPEHAESSNPGLAMTRRFLREFVEDPSEPVAIVHVTSPFLRVETVEEAWGMVRYQDEYDSAASVTVIRDFCFRQATSGDLIPLNHDFRHIPGTQDLDPVYHLNHAFYIVSRESLGAWGHRVGDRPLLVPLDFPESLDIDWEHDFQLASALLQAGVVT